MKLRSKPLKRKRNDDNETISKTSKLNEGNITINDNQLQSSNEKVLGKYDIGELMAESGNDASIKGDYSVAEEKYCKQNHGEQNEMVNCCENSIDHSNLDEFNSNHRVPYSLIKKGCTRNNKAAENTRLNDSKIVTQNEDCNKNTLSLLKNTLRNVSSNNPSQTNTEENKQVKISGEKSDLLNPTNASTSSNEPAQLDDNVKKTDILVNSKKDYKRLNKVKSKKNPPKRKYSERIAIQNAKKTKETKLSLEENKLIRKEMHISQNKIELKNNKVAPLRIKFKLSHNYTTKKFKRGKITINDNHLQRSYRNNKFLETYYVEEIIKEGGNGSVFKGNIKINIKIFFCWKYILSQSFLKRYFKRKCFFCSSIIIVLVV